MATFNLSLDTITATIGYRADGQTVQSDVSVDIYELSANPELMQAVLTKGLYALAAEYKTSGAPESEIEFTALMSGFKGDALVEFATRERKRGKASVEYPQAMRMLDASVLEKFQARALRFNRFIPLPATPSASFSELVKNKREGELKTMDLFNVAREWSLLRAETIEGGTKIDTNARKALEALTKYLGDIGNPAFIYATE